jgi:hypothetical protein
VPNEWPAIALQPNEVNARAFASIVAFFRVAFFRGFQGLRGRLFFRGLREHFFDSVDETSTGRLAINCPITSKGTSSIFGRLAQAVKAGTASVKSTQVKKAE